nr:hypothetical protein [uncultured bacterium]
MKGRKLVISLVLALLILPNCIGICSAQSEEERYFEETGHTVRGAFLEFFQSADDSLLLFGYPITDEFEHPITHVRVQYFQKVRLDLVKGGSGYQVQLAPLGEDLRDDTAPLADIPADSPACRQISDYAVCYAFLQFYDANNGTRYLGEPISNAQIYEGRIIQNFEYSRLEWRPEMPSGQKVGVADLGRIHYDRTLGDTARLLPDESANITGKLVQPHAYAFVDHPLLTANSQQTISVIVLDNSLNPLSGAIIKVEVFWPDGSTGIYVPSDTDADGISQMAINSGNYAANQIIRIQITATYRGETAETSTWFRLWW